MFEIFSLILPTLISSIAGFVTWRAQKIIGERDIERRTYKILMRSQLRDLHEKYIKRGKITAAELAEFEEIYEIYHELHGNGQGTIWKEDIEKLERSDL